MKGKPKYKEGDLVEFEWQKDAPTKIGTVYIIDKYGTWDDPSDVSYDIMVKNDEHEVMVGMMDGTPHKETRIGDCLYKHISERFIHGKKRKPRKQRSSEGGSNS